MNENSGDKKYSHFSHRECEFYPCHRGADPESFSCLFCYCPLYALGRDCGGNYRFTAAGVKDCSECLIPHSAGGYAYVSSRLPEITELINRSGDSR